MNDPTQSAPRDPEDRPSATRTEPPYGHREAAPGEEWEQARLALAVAKDWVQQHQTAAMLGAFAFGAFIGVMMRD